MNRTVSQNTPRRANGVSVAACDQSPRMDDTRVRVSVIVPARNERGNLARIVRDMPLLGSETEILIVEGGSQDGTRVEAERLREAYAGNRDIRVLAQHGRGKWGAVRTGFAAATGDILMVLDADCTVEPGSLQALYEAFRSRRGEFVFGSRLRLPMERGAMPRVNLFLNHCMGWMVTRITGQRVADALCGAKAMYRADVERMEPSFRSVESWDRYGDLALFLGAAQLGLRMVEVPVRYRARTYGTSGMARLREGCRFLWILGIMTIRLRM